VVKNGFSKTKNALLENLEKERKNQD